METAISAAPGLTLLLHMEEGAWDRAVELAKGRESAREVEALTLDGVVKCAQGKLPTAKLFAPFTQLKRLSIANVGLSSLADFPSLLHLERLILSDNRIAGGLEHLVYAGLKSLRELDLSNNKIQALEDLKPLVELKLESLDLYECPVTRSADYRAKVFGMMKLLRFLDKTDMTGNERPESDDEESEEEDMDDLNGDGVDVEGDEVEANSKGALVLMEDEEEEGDDDDERDDEVDDNEELEDEEEDEGGTYQEEVIAAASVCGVVLGHTNTALGSDEEEVEDEDDNVEVHGLDEASEEEDGGGEDEGAATEVGTKDEEEPASGAHVSVEGELDVQDNEDAEDDNGEPGEDEEDDDAVDNECEEEVEEEDDEEEEYGTKYLMQPICQPEDEGASDFEPGDEEEDEDIEDDESGDPVKEPEGLRQNRKRIRDDTGEKEDRSAKR